jgi:hypothetical protein
MNFLSNDIFDVNQNYVKENLGLLSKDVEDKNGDNASKDIAGSDVPENSSEDLSYEDEEEKPKVHANVLLERFRSRFSHSRRLLPLFFDDDVVVCYCMSRIGPETDSFI